MSNHAGFSSRSFIRIAAILLTLAATSPITLAGDELRCIIDLRANPPDFLSFPENGNGQVIVSAAYDGDLAVVKLEAINLPEFASGWSATQTSCAQCVVVDTLYFSPGYCDSGTYQLRFIGQAAYQGGRVADTVLYTIRVSNVNRPISVDAGPDRAADVGESVEFTVAAYDKDALCPDSRPPLWTAAGYPFSHGAVFVPSGFSGVFRWTPAEADTGSHLVTFSASDGLSESVDTVTIIIAGGAVCDPPIMVAEPEYTPGTHNEVYCIPGADAYQTELCCFDPRESGLIGCQSLIWDKGYLGPDTLSWIFENLVDSTLYGYFAKSICLDGRDTIILLSGNTYSRQDGSPPEKVCPVSAAPAPGGKAIVEWTGVLDRVSYVAQYYIYRKTDCQDFGLIDSVTAPPGNNPCTKYTYTDSLGGTTGLEEGKLYCYTVRAVDAVGNIGGGCISPNVIIDATPPPIPKIHFHADFIRVATAFVKGTTLSIRAVAEGPGLHKADFVRIQIARDSLKFFEDEWGSGYTFFDSDWLPYDTSCIHTFDLASVRCDSLCVHGHRYYIRGQSRDSCGNISQRTRNDSIYYWSVPESLYADCLPPGEVLNLAVMPKIDTLREVAYMRLTWKPAFDGVTGLKWHHIYRSIGDSASQVRSTPDSIYNDSLQSLAIRRQVCYQIGTEDFVGNVRLPDPHTLRVCAYPAVGPVITIKTPTVFIDETYYVMGDSLTVSWEDYLSEGVAGYFVHINGSHLTIDDPGVKQITLPITEDVSYSIRVRGTLVCGSPTTWSNAVIVKRDATGPSPVTSLVASEDKSDSGNIYLAWTASHDPIGIGRYYIQRRLGAADYDTIDSTESTRYTDTYIGPGDDTLVALQYYSYRVIPADRLGNRRSDGNCIASAYCTKPPRLRPPLVRNDSICLEWERPMPNRFMTTWNTQVCDSAGSVRLCAIVASRTAHAFKPASTGWHHLAVREVASVGGDSTVWSRDSVYFLPDSLCLVLHAQPLPIPEIDKNSRKGRIRLAWESICSTNCEIDFFVITRSGPGGDTLLGPFPSDVRHCYDSGLMRDTKYDYRLRAIGESCGTIEANTVSAMITPYWVFTPKLIAPKIAFFSGDTIPITWSWFDYSSREIDNTLGAESCRIQVSRDSDFSDSLQCAVTSWLPARDRTGSVDITCLSVEDGEKVYLRIEAVDNYPDTSRWSDEYFGPVVLTKDAVPPPPVSHIRLVSRALPSPEPNTIEVRINWKYSYDKGSGLKHYKIYRYGPLYGSDTPRVHEFVTENPWLVDPYVYSKTSGDSIYWYHIYPVDNTDNQQLSAGCIFLPILETPVLKDPDSVQQVRLTYTGEVDSLYAECSRWKSDLGTVWMDVKPHLSIPVFDPDIDAVFDPDPYFNDTGMYYYHIKAIRIFFDTLRCESGWSVIMGRPNSHSPADGGNDVAAYYLRNHPNPFNPSTTIEFGLAAAGWAELQIYNIKGELVRSVLNGYIEAGPHVLSWDGTDPFGADVAAGIYIYRLRTGGYVESRKMLLLR